MPISMEIVEGKKPFRLTTFSGVITDVETDRYVKMLGRHEGPLYDVLVDMREADVGQLTKFGVSDAARAMSEDPAINTPRRVAIVAPAEEVFGVSRMFSHMSDASVLNVRLFREYDDAARWIESDE